MWLKYKPCLRKWMAFVCLSGLLAASPAKAGAGNYEEFSTKSWASLLEKNQGPAIAVFTTTDCSHCPEVIDYLHRYVQRQAAAAMTIRLYLIVMDGLDEPELLRQGHYLLAHKLLVFSANRNALQYSVNPKWRGLTPYVALIQQHQAEFVVGKPDAEKLQEFSRKVRS